MAKIKVRPEDFVVDELIELPLTKKGRYTILKLEKRFWNTLDVIDFVARKMQVPKRLFSRAGLKDRYSLSTQYLSYRGDFKETIREKNFTLKPIGMADSPVTPGMLKGNAFCIILRSLTEKEVERLESNTHEIEKHGFPNYFDEQRFGSARHGKGFIAKKLILEHYAGALKLLMCHAHREDGPHERKFKNYCLNQWRNWSGCLNIAPPFYRPILKYLCEHPKDLKGAIKKIDKEFLNLYLLAYQSFLFNEIIYRIVKHCGIDCVGMEYSVGDFLFYHALPATATLREMPIPMLNEKTKLIGLTEKMTEKVLNKEGITLRDMALRKLRLRGVRFKAFERNATVFPKNLTVMKPYPDEIYKKRLQCAIHCTLPPGTYATILIKRLLLGCNN